MEMLKTKNAFARGAKMVRLSAARPKDDAASNKLLDARRNSDLLKNVVRFPHITCGGFARVNAAVMLLPLKISGFRFKMIYSIRSILILVFVMILSLSATAQTQKRVINVFDENKDSEQLLELIDIKIDSKSIVVGKQFKADENWLKDLKIRVKNISGKPLVCFGLSFGLIEGIKQELEPYASYRYGFTFSYGKPIKEQFNVSEKVLLQPNEETVLTYDSLDNLYREVLGKVGEGTFHKAKLMSISVQFENGEWKDTGLLIRKR